MLKKDVKENEAEIEILEKKLRTNYDKLNEHTQDIHWIKELKQIYIEQQKKKQTGELTSVNYYTKTLFSLYEKHQDIQVGGFSTLGV